MKIRSKIGTNTLARRKKVFLFLRLMLKSNGNK